MGHGQAYGRYAMCGEVLFEHGRVAARCRVPSRIPHSHDGEIEDLIAHGKAIPAWEELCERCELPFVRSKGRPMTCPECRAEKRKAA